MKNRDLSSPIEYEVIYKDKIVPVKEKPKYRQEPRYREPKKTYKGGFITMTIIAFLVFVLGVGAAGYLIIVKPDFLFPPAAPAEYSVLYRNNTGDDIVTLDTQKVKKGSTSIPEYQGETPSRPDDASFTYKFTGKWSRKGALPVSTNIEMFADYVPIAKDNVGFLVTWNGYDEKGNAKVLKQERVKGGETADWNDPEPTRPENSEYTYEFDRWDPTDGRTVKQDMVFTAKFKEIKKPEPVVSYHVEWMKYNDEDNLEVLFEDEVEANKRPTPPLDSQPKRIDPNNHYTYEFKEWSPDANKPVTKDMTYIPIYEPTEVIPEPETKEYLVQWLQYSADGSLGLLDEEMVKEGNQAKPMDGPDRADDKAYTYKFKSWSPDDRTPIMHDTTFIPEYTRTEIPPKPNQFLVTWKDSDTDGGRIWDSQIVDNGKVVKYEGKQEPYKPSDSEYSYKFDKWDQNNGGGTITGTTIYTAIYIKTPQQNSYVWDASSLSYSLTKTDSGTIDEWYVSKTENGGHEARVRTIGDGSNPVIDEKISNKTITIPSCIETINERAFDNRKKEFNFTVKFESQSSLKTIKKSAFAYYPQESIDLPDSIEVIEENAFELSLNFDDIEWTFRGLQSFTCPPSMHTMENIFGALTGRIDEARMKGITINIGRGVRIMKQFSIPLYSNKELFIPENVVFIEKFGVLAKKDYLQTILCEADSRPIGWDSDWVASIIEQYKPNIKWGQKEPE